VARTADDQRGRTADASVSRLCAMQGVAPGAAPARPVVLHCVSYPPSESKGLKIWLARRR
jgi:hypothetical protein